MTRRTRRRTIRVDAPPAWMPAWMREGIAAVHPERGPVRLAASFTPGERRILRTMPPMPVSAWAEKYRVVENSSLRGRWRNAFTPYLAGIMDAANMPGVETVIVCKSPQTGGSEAGHNIVGYCVDRLPGPVMYVFPDEITARENAQERIIPMLRGTPRLASMLSGNDDDTSSLRIRMRHLTISLAWSGSVSRLGNKPVRILILDELDKYANPKNEASSEELAEKRTTTWRTRRKIVKISTPTTEDGPIWRAFTQEANARFDFRVKCPHCGDVRPMTMDRVGWPGMGTPDEDPGAVQSQRLAWYACPECGACWTDAERDRAVRGGAWQERETGLPLAAYVERFRPQKVGFHIPALLSYFVSLSEIAAALIRSGRGGPAEKRNFLNQYAAEPFTADFAERSEDGILALCDDRPRGMVPCGPEGAEPLARTLYAGVDTQKGHFRYVIRAFGADGASWLVQCGALSSFDELEQVLVTASYEDAHGESYPVNAVMIDAMGNRTSEVYAWAAKWRGRVFPWQGRRRVEGVYATASEEFFPGALGRVRIPGGLTLYKCDTTFFKGELAHRLSIAPDDPGAFRLHANGRGQLAAYAREMTAEVWDDDAQAWTNPKRRPNHYWDCEVMAMAMEYILRPLARAAWARRTAAQSLSAASAPAQAPSSGIFGGGLFGGGR